MKKFLVISLIVLIVLSLLSIYYINKKYDEVNILSIEKEYNLVINPKNETLDIPLYYSVNDSFLTSKNQITSIYIKNDYTKITASSYSIEEKEKIKYKDKYYYLYLFRLSFSNYDNYTEPLAIQNGLISISYTNGDKLEYDIGNLNLLFNSEIDNKHLIISKLEGIYNEVDDKEILSAINLKIINNTNDKIIINKISLKNDFYDFDYNYMVNEIKPYNTNLCELYNGYSYIRENINEQNLNIELDSNEFFIPIRYLELYEIDKLPLYIEYQIDDIDYLYIQDDFTFRSSSLIIDNNGINMYEYKYN